MSEYHFNFMFVNSKSAIGKIAIHYPVKIRKICFVEERQSALRRIKASLYSMSAEIFKFRLAVENVALIEKFVSL